MVNPYHGGANRYATAITKDGEEILTTRPSLASLTPDTLARLRIAFPYEEGFRSESYGCLKNGTKLSDLPDDYCDCIGISHRHTCRHFVVPL